MATTKTKCLPNWQPHAGNAETHKSLKSIIKSNAYHKLLAVFEKNKSVSLISLRFVSTKESESIGINVQTDRIKMTEVIYFIFQLFFLTRDRIHFIIAMCLQVSIAF
jgi:hypothetical protein